MCRRSWSASRSNMAPRKDVPERPLVQLKMSTRNGRDLYSISSVRREPIMNIIERRVRTILPCEGRKTGQRTIPYSNPSSPTYAPHPKTRSASHAPDLAQSDTSQAILPSPTPVYIPGKTMIPVRYLLAPSGIFARGGPQG